MMLRLRKIYNQLSKNNENKINVSKCTNTKMDLYGSGMTVIDCHAAGEPARIVIGGIPTDDIIGDTIEEKRQYMMNNMDYIRQLLLLEPRGYPCQNANIIIPSVHPKAKFGYIIMEQNKIYPAMSGHNTICVATALLSCGMVEMVPDDQQISTDGSFTTSFMLEAPAGLIPIKAKCKDHNVLQITLTNTASFMDPKYSNVCIKLPLSIPQILSIATPIHGSDDTVIADIAWGGMWYVIVDTRQLLKYGFRLTPSKAKNIVKLGEMIKVAAKEQYPINLNDYYCVDHDELMDYPGPDILCFREAKTNRNAVVMSNNTLEWNKPETWTGMIDRSPCGTGTAAVMAMLHHKNELKVEDEFVHKSIIDTEFIGRIVKAEKKYMYRKCDNEAIQSITPTITGRAWITAYSNIVLDPSDPFQAGYKVSDIW
eukprot:774490_1